MPAALFPPGFLGIMEKEGLTFSQRKEETRRKPNDSVGDIAMKTKKRKTFPVILLLLLPVAAAVYFFQFTPYGYLLTVPYRPAFKEIADHVYINKNSVLDQREILSLIEQAEERDRAFFGGLCYLDQTVFIICDDEGLTRKLGEDHGTVIYSVPFKQHFICISDEYLELDILAHEITHAELHTRLSVKACQRIPTWFDEGLATQNDYRERYSEEQWVLQTDNGKNTVALEDMDTPSEFYAGEAEDRRFRYLNAKHEICLWMEAHGRQGLLELLEKLNDGADFYSVYKR